MKIAAATRHTFRSLRNRNFRLFFVSQSISMAGTWVQLIAQALLVLRLTGSGVALGVATAVQFLPVLLFGAWAGLLSDRLDKRRLMFVTQTAMMVFAFVLGGLVLAGIESLPAVYVLAALTGIATAFDGPARRSIITELVEEDEVANAVSLNGATVNGSKIIGPAIAGILYSTVGIGWCFILNGASYVAVLIGLARMDPARIRRPPFVTRAKGQIREGFRYVWDNRELRVPLVLIAVVATLAFNFQVLVPLFATRDLGGTVRTYTLIATLMSVGSLSGSLWVARRRTVDARFIAVACASFGGASFLLAISPSVLLACIAGMVAAGFGMAFLNAAMATLQLGAVPAMRGRVMALFSMIFLGSTPIGGPVSGWIGEHVGARAGLALGAAAAAIAGLAALAMLRRRQLALETETISDSMMALEAA